MSLTKDDLSAITSIIQTQTRKIIKDELKPINQRLNKIEKKFDELFDFLDKKYIEVKKDIRQIQSHLHLPVSDF